jgi:hypothetical protein
MGRRKIKKFLAKKEKKLKMESLAYGSDMDDYVTVQIRSTGINSLHLQGKGTKVNRAYGVSANIKNVPTKLIVWMNNEIPGYISSLAGTNQKYISAQVAIRGDNLHFQIPSSDEFNRDYGASFDVPIDSDVSAFIKVNITEDDDCCMNCCK